MFRIWKTVSLCSCAKQVSLQMIGVFRICPGVNFADTELFIWCAMILAVYDISKTVGPDGKVAEPIIEYTSAADRYVHES